MRISEEKIEEVRAAADIVEVISDYVQLKRRGQNFIGLCPFHNEKTPSFNVTPHLGIYKCFGCGKGGDVFTFLMETEHIGFMESVRTIAEKVGVVLPTQEVETEENAEIDSIHHALRFAARFFWEQLTQTPTGKALGLGYFRGRGFSNETIKAFGLGYAPDQWSGLLDTATRHHIRTDFLAKAGLILPNKDETSYYDRYRGRVIFPIFSHIGKIVGFGGRILTNTKDQPKYINSPETAVYKKSQILYGLYQSKNEIRKTEEAILVEGYTDVISLHQAGVKHVVASSGTALTPQQVKLLSRYAKRVLMIYDADAAGVNATLRGIGLVFSQGLSAEIVELPEGADPDSFVQKFGGEAFLNYIQKHKQRFIAFKLKQAQKSGVWQTAEGRAQTVHELMQTIAAIPDAINRDFYIREAAETLNLPEATLRTGIKAPRQLEASLQNPVRAFSKNEKVLAPSAANRILDTPSAAEKALLRLMLTQPSAVVFHILAYVNAGEFQEGVAQDLFLEILHLYQEEQFQVERLVRGEFGVILRDLVAELMVPAMEVSDNWAKRIKGANLTMDRNPYEVAEDAMTRLKLAQVDRAIHETRTALAATQQAQTDPTPLLAQINALHELRKQVERRDFLQSVDNEAS